VANQKSRKTAPLTLWITVTAVACVALSSGAVGCDSDETTSSTSTSSSTSTGTGGSSTSSGTGGSGATGGGSQGGGGSAPGCGTITTFEDGKTPSAELHVATTGSDQTGDGSASTPYGSIDFAAAQATPGTAIRVHEGTYSGGESISDLAGTSDDPIWIGGMPGEARPVLDGSAEGLHLTRVSYLVIHDLEITGASANGINCDDGGEYDNPLATHHVVFRGLYIHDIGSGGNQDCLKLSGLYDFFVLDSEMAICGGSMSGSGVDHVGCHRGLLAGNSFHDLSGNAVQAKGGSTDIEIRANHLVNAGERGVNLGGSTGFTFFRPPLSQTEPNVEASDIRVIANVIEGGTTALAYVGCVDCLVANNTIIDPDNWLFRILQETTTSGGYDFLPASNGRFINNLVYFEQSALSTYVNIGANTDPSSFQFANNLWYAHDNPGNSQPNLPTTEQAGVVGSDPAFTTGYEIGSSSPAAAAGIALPEVTADYTGACYGSPPSIGAHEAD